MKYLKTHNLFEAKAKTNWLEITQAKLKEFKQMIDSNPVLSGFNNNEVLDDLILKLQDISGDEFEVYYTEDIKFLCDGDYEQTELTKNGKPRTDFSTDYRGVQNPYLVYTKLTSWLDKKRASGKEIESFYVVYFRSSFSDRDNYDRFYKSDKYKQEWIPEVQNTKDFLKSLGFEISGGDLDFKATIKLANTEEVKKKTLDLSDIVPGGIVDDFEKFILKRGLTRADAEEIAKIFNKATNS